MKQEIVIHLFLFIVMIISLLWFFLGLGYLSSYVNNTYSESKRLRDKVKLFIVETGANMFFVAQTIFYWFIVEAFIYIFLVCYNLARG